MAVTMAAATMTRAKGRVGRDARRNAGLWVVVTGDHQFGDFYFIRLHLFQAANHARLAFLQRLQRIPRRAFHGNVWFPVDDLSLIRLAAESLSECGLVFA